eukprot:4276597-Amphidinium_carterae.1
MLVGGLEVCATAVVWQVSNGVYQSILRSMSSSHRLDCDCAPSSCRSQASEPSILTPSVQVLRQALLWMRNKAWEYHTISSGTLHVVSCSIAIPILALKSKNKVTTQSGISQFSQLRQFNTIQLPDTSIAQRIVQL